MSRPPLSVFAPSKINLYLHVTGRRDDGYHLLDSLVCFTDVGDTITIESAPRFSFSVQGRFAPSFTARDKASGPKSSNLAVRAAYALSAAVGKPLDLRLRLTKALPLGGGIGGGSSDAAATLWGLIEWWRLPPQAAVLPPLMLTLGSDVPVCFHCKSVRMQGVGEHLIDAPEIPELPILLVHCGKPCPTADMYKALRGAFSAPADMPDKFLDTGHFIDFLHSTHNDFTEAALDRLPDIAFVLDTLRVQKNAMIARMSGSGSTCFALFPSEDDCLNAAETIIRNHPLWWVRTGIINRPVRY